MRPPTIRDVAERAGVSKSLVSLVLRGLASTCSPDEAAGRAAGVEELGYRPNAIARQPHRAAHPHRRRAPQRPAQPLVRGLLEGLNPVLHDDRTADAAGRWPARPAGRRGPAPPLPGAAGRRPGAVGTLPDPRRCARRPARVPTVVAGARDTVLPEVDVVAGDDELGARLATEHLIGLGHRRIAHIAGRRARSGELRRRGFEDGDARRTAWPGGDRGAGRSDRGGRLPGRRPAAGRPRPAHRGLRLQRHSWGRSPVGRRGARPAGAATTLSLVGYDNTYLARLRHCG